MTKEERVEYVGEITELLPDGVFRVKLEIDQEVAAVWAGKPGEQHLELSLNDRVLVEVTPYDLARARIVLRLEH